MNKNTWIPTTVTTPFNSVASMHSYVVERLQYSVVTIIRILRHLIHFSVGKIAVSDRHGPQIRTPCSLHTYILYIHNIKEGNNKQNEKREECVRLCVLVGAVPSVEVFAGTYATCCSRDQRTPARRKGRGQLRAAPRGTSTSSRPARGGSRSSHATNRSWSAPWYTSLLLILRKPAKSWMFIMYTYRKDFQWHGMQYTI